MPEPTPTRAIIDASNWKLVVRLFGLAWRYRLHCFRVLLIQLVLLSMGLVGLSLTGVGIDYMRHKVQRCLSSGHGCMCFFLFQGLFLQWQYAAQCLIMYMPYRLIY